jgi:hypothetical protein
MHKQQFADRNNDAIRQKFKRFDENDFRKLRHVIETSSAQHIESNKPYINIIAQLHAAQDEYKK